MSRFIRWWNDDHGATAVEYAVVLAIIVAVIIGVRQFGTATSNSFQDSSDQIEDTFPDM